MRKPFYLVMGRILFLLCAAFAFKPNGAYAQEFPVRDNGNTDIIAIDNPDVDFALREKFISEAKVSVRMINFLHGADEVGYRIARALRRAANNGVQVQYAYEESISRGLGSDKWGHISKLLTDSNLKHPIELVTGHLCEKRAACLAINDYFHEKLIIIDGGTPNEKIFVGGRGATAMDTKLFDSGFLIRPVDPSKPYLGTDLQAFFETLWSTLREIYSLEPRRNIPDKLVSLITQLPEDYPLDSELKGSYEKIVELAATAPKAGLGFQSGALPMEFRPKQVQLIGNHFLMTLVKGGVRKTIFARPEISDNPVIQKISSMVKGASNVELSSYALNFPEDLDDAFVEMLRHGGHVDFLTNGRDAHRIFAPLGLPSDMTSEAFLRLYNRANALPGQINLQLFKPQAASFAASDSRSPVYLHRKRMLIDDATVFGSDNLTLSSATKNDELVIIANDAEMTNAFRSQSAGEKPRFFGQASAANVQHDLRKTQWLSNTCIRLIEAMY